MEYPKQFIKATEEFSDYNNYVPAPYIRKTFVSDCDTTAKIIIGACGFYELYLNGQRYTKGFFAPYISNTDHYIYCDEYEIPITKGENVLALMLGNGLQNNPGGAVWEFDKVAFRSAPMVALKLEYKNSAGEDVVIESDSSFKVHESPIRSDDYRFGEYYNANFEIPGWNEKGFDDSLWGSAIETKPPRGELRVCTAEPIVKEMEIKPVEIIKDGDGYIYDFGINHTGVCRVKIDGKKGQKVVLEHAELLKNGTVDLVNIWFERFDWERDKKYVHKDVYICKGEKNETYMPTFTYHGFRYVRVTGITPEQATKELLTFCIIHSDIKSRGGFKCSDETVNKLQEMTRRSDISNFHYFPTDCPHREKNGWTADAALSCEHMLLNFAPEVSFREWLRNICKSQNAEGVIPGVVPSSGWGYGCGPAWDSVLTYLPYYVYIYRGEIEMIKESTQSFLAYLGYLISMRNEKGLISVGLGDWCQVGGGEIKAPLVVTSSIIAMDIAEKMAVMFDAVGLNIQCDFAKAFAREMKEAIRENLIDYDSMTIMGNVQSCQAMGLFYNIFTHEEKDKAFSKLLDMIHEADDHIDVGVLGGRVIFHVLSEFGYSDLALKMIARPDYPSYGHWVQMGVTTLWESFLPDELVGTEQSNNHHFWGDISGWFIKNLAGIQLNPNKNNVNEVLIKPSFVSEIDYAEGYHEAPAGKIVSSWRRGEEGISLDIEIPDEMTAMAVLNDDFCFEDGKSSKAIVSGKYLIKKK